ncbi:hypothetical protein [Actinokineospora pegani]|uniref:hypothetical protein n=1 Tax=Actinokineospora pegani TaxID=2654637 RepID=UPI0012EA2D3E|nr:hypothetical protein [Actinokineospora pegani]
MSIYTHIAGHDGPLTDDLPDVAGLESALALLTDAPAVWSTSAPVDVTDLLPAAVTGGGYDDLYAALLSGDPTHTAPDDGLRALGVRLVTEADDRGPVRFGLTLLGPDDVDLLLEVGRHPVFTATAATRLTEVLPDPSVPLMRLARSVEGWPRVAVVSCLTECASPEVREWLVRDGYRHSAAEPYLIPIAARHLAEVLAGPVDPALLGSACEIISTLLDEAHFEVLDDIPDTPSLLAALLRKLEHADHTLGHLTLLTRLDVYLSGPGWDTRYRTRGWTLAWHETLTRRVRDLLSSPAWRPLVETGLRDPAHIHAALSGASSQGIDPFPALLAHVRRTGEDWPMLLTWLTPHRLPEILAAAGEHPLAPAALDALAAALAPHPNHGPEFLLAALASPEPHTRAVATRTLTTWGPATWSPDIQTALRAAIATEPSATLRQSMTQLLV